ncbi:hypothetical protein SFRURICE_003277 [Spodoptera frugiperda]|nr:hypothetical protein SFRURICE_003277 [Spodoptera frugiperda]
MDLLQASVYFAIHVRLATGTSSAPLTLAGDGTRTRSQFKRPATPSGVLVSDSGESDCSQTSFMSQVSTASITTRARKRTRKDAKSAQSATEMLPDSADSDKKALEKLAKENADLRAQISSLTEIVAGLRNQLNIITSQQHGGNPNSQASILSVPAGLAPDVEAQLRRSIAIEIGGMMDAKLAALEGRLLPEKTIRPALASDTRRLVVSQPIQEEPTTKPKEIGKKKRKKGKQKGKAVTPAVVELPAVSTSSGQDKHQEIATSQTNNTWSLVVGRKAKKSNALQSGVSSAPVTQTRVPQKKRLVKLPKVPTSAAITICVKEGATVGLGDVLSAAKRQINIAEFGITADLLQPRRMMCYRCFEPGHVRRKCTSATDRSAQCYACGGAHKARECTSPTLRCPGCSDQGRPAGHRLGSQACNPQRKKGSNKNLTQASFIDLKS